MHPSKRQLQKKTLKDTAKFRRQVQTWAASDENGPHAAQTPKPTLQNVLCFDCSTKRNKKAKNNSKKISKGPDRQKKTTNVWFLFSCTEARPMFGPNFFRQWFQPAATNFRLVNLGSLLNSSPGCVEKHLRSETWHATSCNWHANL